MKLLINKLSKTYPNGVKALCDIDLEIGRGMFGLLGPNGAGKSSLMRTLATLQNADTGQIIFNGIDIFADTNAYRRQLGYLPQEFGVYPRESAQSLLNYFAVLKGLSSKKDRQFMVDKVLALTNLENVRKKSVHTFSGGMRQRFGIAQMLLNQPKMIIVDEPTAGLDPAERSRFLNVLRNISYDSIVLFSTHLVEDVKALCNDMAIIDKGRIVQKILPSEAIEQLRDKIWETPLSKDTLQTYGVPFTVLSTHYNGDKQAMLRIHAEMCPSESCLGVSPKLEDFYFLSLKNNDNE